MVSGEMAFDRAGHPALLEGVRWYASPLFTGYLLARHYDASYFALRSRTLSRSGHATAETGLLLGMQLMPAAGMQVSGYVDIYRSPLLQRSISAPPWGSEAGAALTWQIRKEMQLYITWRHDEYRRDLPQGTKMQCTGTVRRDHLRLQTTYPLAGGWSTTTRLDLNRWQNSATAPRQGYFAGQDLHYRSSRQPLYLHARFALFDTRYETRIYTYEHDLLYAFSTPAFTGRGIRWYLLLSLPLARGWQGSVRLSRTLYRDRQELGSGPARVSVPQRTELKVQLRWHR